MKQGLFEIAAGGTLFLDEIAEMDITVQARLLKALEDKRFRRLGGLRDLSANFRLIAATNRDLANAVEKGTFRGDLYYRLSVVNVRLAPLRDRKEDIPLLVQHFFLKYGEDNKKTDLELTPEALDLLTAYDWPGNVRELENVIERAVVLTPGPRIGVELVPEPNFWGF